MSEDPATPNPDSVTGPQKRAAIGFPGDTSIPPPYTSPTDTSADPEATVLLPADSAHEVIGDFEVLGKLGQGGMGAVYRARQISLDRFVALKLLPASLEIDETFVTRFQREARIAASLSHRNLVRVYATGLAAGSHYIAMELVEGETLGQSLKRGPLPPAEALRICLDVARALDCGWRHAQLIHRDIKPGNIFLSQEGEVKVGDLGLAKSMSGDTTGLTHTGTAMGTPHYISPEQARGDKDLDFRADIYSLGCTLFQMLTGRTPYEGRDPLTVMNQHINAPPPAILKVLPHCPIPLARLVGKMLKKIKRERQASYEELIAQIQSVQKLFAPAESALESTLPPDPEATLLETPGAFATPRSATPVTVPIAAPPARAKKSKAPLYAGAGLTVLLVAALAAFLLRPQPAAEKLSLAERHMLEQEAARAAAAPPPQQVWRNLIALIDPQRDGLVGEWKIENGTLISARRVPWSICVIPVENAPKNYDLRYRVTRGEGQGVGFFFPFRRGDQGGNVIFDYGNTDHPKWGGIDTIGGRRVDQTGQKRDMWLPKGQLRTILVQVRDEGIAVRLDDEEVFRWTGDWSQIRQRGGVNNEIFKKVEGNQPVFGVGLFNSEAVYQSIELREVPGHEGQTLPKQTTSTADGLPAWQPLLVENSPTPSSHENPIEYRDGVLVAQKGRVLERQPTADAAIRALIQIKADMNFSALVLRKRSDGFYKCGIGRDKKSIGMTYFPAEGYKILGRAEIAPLSDGETVELEFRVVGTQLTAYLNGRQVITATDTNLTEPGSWGVAADGPAYFARVEGRSLPVAQSPVPANRQPSGSIRMFDSPGKIPLGNGISWDDNALRLEGTPAGYTGTIVSAATVRAEIRPSPATDSVQVSLRHGTTENERVYYTLQAAPKLHQLRLQKSGDRGQDLVIIQRWPLPTSEDGSEWLRLELRAGAGELTALANDRPLDTVREPALPDFSGFVLYAAPSAHFRNIEYTPSSASPDSAKSRNRGTSSAVVEPWQDLLADPAKLHLSAAAQITPQGLRLAKNSIASLSRPAQRDGAVRARFTYDGAVRPQLGIRTSSSGTYSLAVRTSAILSLGRWDAASGQSVTLKDFLLSPSLTPGQSVEFELRAVGKTLTAKVNGTIVGTVDDDTVSTGGCNVANLNATAPEPVIESFQFLDLDAAPAAAEEPWKDLFLDHSNFQIFGGTTWTPEGLKLINVARPRAELTPQNDLGVRFRAVFGGMLPQISARWMKEGFYCLLLNREGTHVRLNTWNNITSTAHLLAVYPLPTPLKPGQEYQIELRIVGSTLTSRFNGITLGETTDTTFPAGPCDLMIADHNGAPALIKSFEVLDLGVRR